MLKFPRKNKDELTKKFLLVYWARQWWIIAPTYSH